MSLDRLGELTVTGVLALVMLLCLLLGAGWCFSKVMEGVDRYGWKGLAKGTAQGVFWTGVVLGFICVGVLCVAGIGWLAETYLGLKVEPA